MSYVSVLSLTALFMLYQFITDTVSRVAVPERRNARLSFVPWSCECVQCRLRDSFRVRADDCIRSHRDRDGSLCVLAQSQAGNSERGRFLLNAARICQHQARAA